MATRRKKAPELCAEHFPYGLADQPADATVVSCAHGSWDVTHTAPAADPEPPADADGDSGGE